MKAYFDQCHRCGQWVCKQVCWNSERGLCTTCAPKLDQEIAGMQAAAQINQLNDKIQQVDWTRDINYRDQGTGKCPSLRAGDRWRQVLPALRYSARGGARGDQEVLRQLRHPADAGKAFCAECGTPAV